LAQLLGRDAIFSAPDIQTEDVLIPEWGGAVRVKGLNAAERDAYEASIVGKGKGQKGPNYSNVRARLVALTVIDEAGNQLFGPADVRQLGEKSAAPIDRIYDVAARLSGITEEDEEELEGNSEPGQSDGSSSD
jgi:hypothetical protein